MHFGLSYVGLIYLFMLMLPNIVWTKNQPKDYEKYASGSGRNRSGCQKPHWLSEPLFVWYNKYNMQNAALMFRLLL